MRPSIIFWLSFPHEYTGTSTVRKRKKILLKVGFYVGLLGDLLDIR
jgi:hypothetical protein